jgi:hypothetical protein
MVQRAGQWERGRLAENEQIMINHQLACKKKMSG